MTEESMVDSRGQAQILAGKIALNLLIGANAVGICRIKINRASRHFTKRVHDVFIVLSRR